jgi:3-polyprenyl-4-hydroxybenzoate decarboxylase
MESREGGLAFIVFPPVSAFYHRPVAIHDVATHSVARALDLETVD